MFAWSFGMDWTLQVLEWVSAHNFVLCITLCSCYKTLWLAWLFLPFLSLVCVSVYTSLPSRPPCKYFFIFVWRKAEPNQFSFLDRSLLKISWIMDATVLCKSTAGRIWNNGDPRGWIMRWLPIPLEHQLWTWFQQGQILRIHCKLWILGSSPKRLLGELIAST